MSTDQEYDLVVVGGGIAGLVTASRAGQLGLRTCLLEKGSADRYLCNTRFTGGTIHICLDDIMADSAKLRKAIDTVTYGATPAALADAMVSDGPRAIRWMQSVGIRFMKASPAPYHNWVLAPPRPPRPGLEWEGRGGDVMMRSLGALIEKQGGKLVRGARARTLIMENGRCVGVEADTDGKSVALRGTAVVIADGGFQANPELVRENISPRPESLRQRGAATGMGDGLLMARSAGAQLTKLDSFYGHVLSRDAMKNEALWPYPVLDSIVAAAIAVDSLGKRFADEGESGVYFANSIARLADPLGTFAVFDDTIWSTTGKRDLIPVNPLVPDNGGTVLKAQSLAELASIAGIASETLAATVREYNEAAKNGTTAQLSPSRRGDKTRPQAIEKPPFYAIPLCAGITYTMGGIAINEHGRVLGTSGAPIAGLYAAGSCVGGVDGGPKAGYVGGLSKAAVLGLRCAEDIARASGRSVS